MSRIVVWFSCGAASAVAAKLTLEQHPDAIVAYCATRSEHPDNERFMQDCQRWFKRPVMQMSSMEFQDTCTYGRRSVTSLASTAPPALAP